MSFDLFCDNQCKTNGDIESIVQSEEILDTYTKVKLLAGGLHYCKDYARSGVKRNEPSGHKLLIHDNKQYNNLIKEEIERLENLKLYKPSISITDFPNFSFFIQFKFELVKPYLSRDDEIFYICDNPIRKDKVFKVPMITPSTWKGHLRWTAGRGKDSNDPEIIRLFGNDRKEQNKDNLRQGRLIFYPTFFDKIDLEVINPHDRSTKAGTQPIYFESVPTGASGFFSIFYLPFDILGEPEKLKEQSREDLIFICENIKEMMLTYGFSAKKHSGFGLVKSEITEGALFFNFNSSEKKKQLKNLKEIQNKATEIIRECQL